MPGKLRSELRKSYFEPIIFSALACAAISIISCRSSFLMLTICPGLPGSVAGKLAPRESADPAVDASRAYDGLFGDLEDWDIFDAKNACSEQKCNLGFQECFKNMKSRSGLEIS